MRYPLQSAPSELFHCNGSTWPNAMLLYSGLRSLNSTDCLDRTSYFRISGGDMVVSATPTTTSPLLATVDPEDVADGLTPKPSKTGVNPACSIHDPPSRLIQANASFPFRTSKGEVELFQNRVGFCDHTVSD